MGYSHPRSVKGVPPPSSGSLPQGVCLVRAWSIRPSQAAAFSKLLSSVRVFGLIQVYQAVTFASPMRGSLRWSRPRPCGFCLLEVGFTGVSSWNEGGVGEKEPQ
jgi:hypothetical protein